MRTSIVLKLFLLTAGLCITVIAGIFIGQTVFFEQFYVAQKVRDVQAALDTVVQARQTPADDAIGAHAQQTAEDATIAFERERRLYENHNTWVTILDETGTLKAAHDFILEVRLDDGASIPSLSGAAVTIPLYTVMSVDDLHAAPFIANPFIEPGNRVAIEGLFIDGQLFPQRIARSTSALRDENRLENAQLVSKEFEVVARFDSASRYREQFPSVLVTGTVTNLQTPCTLTCIRQRSSETRFA